MEGVYNTFHERFKFDSMEFPPLDFEGPGSKLHVLMGETEQFCKDPVSIVATEKRFMVRRFWRQLVDQARQIFNEARTDTERWLAAVPLPLETQIKDHKTQLEARLASLAKINERGDGLKDELAKLVVERDVIQKQVTLITGLILKVRDVGPAPETKAAADAAPLIPQPQKEYLETVRIKSPAAENGGFEKTVKTVASEFVQPLIVKAAASAAASAPSSAPSAPAAAPDFERTQKIDLTKLRP